MPAQTSAPSTGRSFTPAYMRLAPWQMVFFLTFEYINKLSGVKT